jgi:hypothetical protein
VRGFRGAGHEADGDKAMTRRKGEITRGDLKCKYSKRKSGAGWPLARGEGRQWVAASQSVPLTMPELIREIGWHKPSQY